jgi:hypothetical protein
MREGGIEDCMLTCICCSVAVARMHLTCLSPLRSVVHRLLHVPRPKTSGTPTVSEEQLKLLNGEGANVEYYPGVQHVDDAVADRTARAVIDSPARK